ncbi:MAG: sulfotransferase [Planctomycetota bacterium]
MQLSFAPNLFVLGAAKSGSTTLHRYLDRLPDVCMSRPKEPFFFEAFYDRGLDFYREHYFGHYQGERYIGDARHRNLFLPYVPDRIKAVSPDARLIAILRHPVDRALSHWHHYHARGIDQASFKRAISEDIKRIASGKRVETPEEQAQHADRMFVGEDKHRLGLGLYRTYVDTGYYAQQLQRYFDRFDAKQLHVILFDDLEHQPEAMFERLRAFLRVEQPPDDEPEVLHANAALPQPPGRLEQFRRRLDQFGSRQSWRSIVPAGLRATAKAWLRRSDYAKTSVRKPSVSPRTRAMLLRHYEPHTRALEEMLGRSLDAWRT